jgi:hypothetical protein
MKNYIYSLGLVIALMFGASKSLADTAVFSIPGASTGTTIATNLLITGPIRLLSLTVTAGTNLSLFIYDSPTLTNSITVGAYTNYTRTVATTNITYTSVLGVPLTNSYSVIRTTTNTATGGLQLRELVYGGLFISNTVTAIDFASGKFLGNGLLITNLPCATISPVVVNVEYEKLF